MSLNDLAQQIHQTAVEHGFWDEERNFGEMLALMHSELSEALEEHRDGKPVHYYSYHHGPAVHMPTMHFLNGIAYWDPEFRVEVKEEDLVKYGATRKPEGVAVELADCLIRILDTMASLGVNIDEVVREKMAYNDTRSHKHGKAY